MVAKLVHLLLALLTSLHKMVAMVEQMMNVACEVYGILCDNTEGTDDDSDYGIDLDAVTLHNNSDNELLDNNGNNNGNDNGNDSDTEWPVLGDGGCAHFLYRRSGTNQFSSFAKCKQCGAEWTSSFPGRYPPWPLQ
jgi:hypothetical protein